MSGAGPGEWESIVLVSHRPLNCSSANSVRESPVNGENSSGPSSRGSSQPREAPLPPPPFVPPPPCAPPPQHSPPLNSTGGNTHNTGGITHNTGGNTQHNTGQEDTAAKLAATAAQQLELQKKLLEGNEAVTLSQQEDMQIKGQSARHLVMQVQHATPTILDNEGRKYSGGLCRN